MTVNTVDMVAPYPTFAFWKKFWYEKYEATMVEVPGPPWVMAKIWPKTFNEKIVVVSTTT